MKPLRPVLLAGLVGAAALLPVAAPVQAAPAKHIVTMKVTSIEIVNDFDAIGAGDFFHLAFRPVVPGKGWTNIVPSKAPDGDQYSLWTGATYTVPQSGLEGLAAALKPYNGTSLFKVAPVSKSNINRTTFLAVPGATQAMVGTGEEWDFLATDMVGEEHAWNVTLPPAGASKSFSASIDFTTLVGVNHQTGIIMHGTLSTSSAPA